MGPFSAFLKGIQDLAQLNDALLSQMKFGQV